MLRWQLHPSNEQVKLYQRVFKSRWSSKVEYKPFNTQMIEYHRILFQIFKWWANCIVEKQETTDCRSVDTLCLLCAYYQAQSHWIWNDFVLLDWLCCIDFGRWFGKSTCDFMLLIVFMLRFNGFVRRNAYLGVLYACIGVLKREIMKTVFYFHIIRDAKHCIHCNAVSLYYTINKFVNTVWLYFMKCKYIYSNINFPSCCYTLGRSAKMSKGLMLPWVNFWGSC